MRSERPDADSTADPDDVLEAGRERAWQMLDLLPKGEAHPSLAATTIEMAAIDAGSSAREGPRNGLSRLKGRGVAAILLVGSLAAGVVAGGRRNGPPYDPLVIAVGRHLAVLQEAGSVEFLRKLSLRDLPPPRRPAGPRSPAASVDGGDGRTGQSYPELEAAIADVRAALGRADDQLPPAGGQRRSEETLRALERLSVGERQAVVATARALADPEEGDLVEAARRWHEWVEASDPVERRILPTLGTKERLAWLVRRSRPWRRPGIRGPLPPPDDVGPAPVRVPRENRGPGG